NNSGEDDAWPKAVGHPSARDFTGSVGNGEDADDPAPLLWANAKVFLNARTGNRDADAIEVGDHCKKEQQGADSVAMSEDWQHLRPHATTERRGIKMEVVDYGRI